MFEFFLFFYFFFSSSSSESDPDVFSSFPFMRMHPSHPRFWYHRYQHWYAPILFAFMTLSKVFQQDVEMFHAKRLYHISASARYGSSSNSNESSTSTSTTSTSTSTDIYFNRGRFVIMKCVSLFFMLVCPLYYQGVAKGSVLFLVGHLVCGELLATMFIVNHVIEGVAFVMHGMSTPTTSQGIAGREETSSQESHSKKSEIPNNDWAAVQCQVRCGSL